MDTERVNEIREAANRAAISDIANQLITCVNLNMKVEDRLQYVLEIAYILNDHYGTGDTDIEDYLHRVEKKLHGKKAGETGVDKSDV